MEMQNAHEHNRGRRLVLSVGSSLLVAMLSSPVALAGHRMGSGFGGPGSHGLISSRAGGFGSHFTSHGSGFGVRSTPSHIPFGSSFRATSFTRGPIGVFNRSSPATPVRRFISTWRRSDFCADRLHYRYGYRYPICPPTTYYYPGYVYPYGYYDTGYPYYYGGTNFTIVEPPSYSLVQTPGAPPVRTPYYTFPSGTTIPAPDSDYERAQAATQPTSQPSSSSPPSAGEGSSERYGEMLELTEMIHEWRSLNESPEFQARIPAQGADVSSHVKELVGEVKTLNHRFDQLTRKAMKELSAGRDAQAEIEGARSTLDLLTLKVGDLPQAHVPSSPTDVPKTSKPSP